MAARCACRTVRLLLVVITLCELINCRYSDESEFTISVEPGKRECFFQSVKTGQILEVEYQVLDAGSNLADSNLAIDFSLTSPSGVSALLEEDKSDAVHRYEARQDGDYKLCLSNERSMLSTKLIYLEVFVDNGDSAEVEDDDPFDLGTVTYAPETRYDTSIVDAMKARILSVYDHLEQVERYQKWQTAHEARHRNLQENNYLMVNYLSMICVVIMVVVGGVQVFFVKSLFENQSMVYKLLRSVERR